jgi:predicted ester cyclase
MTDAYKERLRSFAQAYAAAWSSQNAARVASFFAENGSLRVNDSGPAIGRNAITGVAQSFMTAFPDMIVSFDELRFSSEVPHFHWTLTGTDSGAGGRGRAVRISGYEQWTIGEDGLIAASRGHFDSEDYQRQLGEEA